MTMGPSDELKIPLRIDTSQVEADLRAVDKELARLEQRVIRTFNRTVANAGTGQATKLSDVRAFLGQSGPLAAATLEASPELARALRSLEQREQAIARQAAAGRTSLPATERQEALARLRQVGTGQGAPQRPTEITARAEFFDRMRQSLLRGLSTAPAMAAAQTGIPGAWGLARTLGGLAEANPWLFGGASALVGGVGLGALVNAQQAGFQRQQAALASALVGGPAFGSTRTLLGLGVMQAGQGLDVGRDTANEIAQQLALAGVGRADLVGNLSNVLMTAMPAGIKPADITPLVAALGTSGGMSAAQINRTLQDVVNVASDAGVSLQELLGGMKALSSGAVGAARDVLSLAAIQRIVGPTSGMQAGALMQGVMGATGAQALQSAALLDMTPGAFMAAQGSRGGMAQIWDRIAAFSRRLPSGPAGTLVAEQMLGQTGLLNMQGLSATQQGALVQTLRQQGPRAAEQLAARYGAQTARQVVSPQQSFSNAAHAADRVTGAFDRLRTGVENWWTTLINPPGVPAVPHRPSVDAAIAGAAGPTAHTVTTDPRWGVSFSHLAPPGRGAAPPARGSGGAPHGAGAAVQHNVAIKVTVQDQHGRTLPHTVNHQRVQTGAVHHGTPPPGHPRPQ